MQEMDDDDDYYHIQDLDATEPWERSLRRVVDEATRLTSGNDSSSSRLVLLEHSESRDYCVAMDEEAHNDEMSLLSDDSFRNSDFTKSNIYRANKLTTCLMDCTTPVSSSSFTLRNAALKRIRSHPRTGSSNAAESREEIEEFVGRRGLRLTRGTTFDGGIVAARVAAFPLQRAGAIGDENLSICNSILASQTSWTAEKRLSP